MRRSFVYEADERVGRAGSSPDERPDPKPIRTRPGADDVRGDLIRPAVRGAERFVTEYEKQRPAPGRRIYTPARYNKTDSRLSSASVFRVGLNVVAFFCP